MSTRATYEIDGEVFYIHHDGYPAGAASYFAKMIEAMNAPAMRGGIEAIEDRRGGARFAFIRGNMRAEPTESHQAHGDTEYRWTLFHDGHRFQIRHDHRPPGADKWRGWTALEPLADFINRHYPGLIVAIEPADPYRRRPEILATLEHAIAIAELELGMATGFAEGNPNKNIHADLYAAWAEAIGAAATARRRWLEKEAAEARAELEKGGQWGRAHYLRWLMEAEHELEEIARFAPAAELEEPRPLVIPGQRPGETAMEAQDRRSREILGRA